LQIQSIYFWLLLNPLQIMKKLLLLLVLFALMGTSRAQITPEHNYTASTGLTELAISGYKYFLMDVTNSQCRLYNMDHSLWKTINLPVPTGMYLYDIKYVSETLFNADSKVELAYIYYYYDATLLYYTYYTKVINQDGVELLSIPGCAYLEVYSPGSYGTKMLAWVYDYSIVNYTVNTMVYSLPGNLPTGANQLTVDPKMSKPFPNPAGSEVTIPYELPDGVNTAEIQLMNGSGQVIHHYTVDRTFHELLIRTTGMPKGVFLYQLKTDQGIISSGKFIHD
jgi:hypothetical protein